MYTDSLIQAICVRSPIWDKRDRLHANRSTIDMLWKEIGSELQVDETILRKKWKYLREKFCTEFNKQRLREAGDKDDNTCPTSAWPFYQKLVFLKDVVGPKVSSLNKYPTPTSITDASMVALPDGELAADVYYDDGTSQCSHESHLTEETSEIQENQQDVSRDNIQISSDACLSPSHYVQNPAISSNRKRPKKNQEIECYDRLIDIEERKFEYLVKKHARKETDFREEDEDLMFLKTLVPHMRKIPQHMKLRCRSRISSVVEEFAYGPGTSQNQPVCQTRSISYSVDQYPLPLSVSSAHTP